MYYNNTDDVLEAVKHALFDTNNEAQTAADGTEHNLKWETWCGDTRSFIVSDDGVRYRISVDKEMEDPSALNTDINTRDTIIFGRPYDKTCYSGGYRSFKGLTAEKLQLLVDQKFASGTENQNGSPSIADFLEYAKEHKNVTLAGYVIDITRDDYRVSVDSIEQDFETSKDIEEFSEMFHSADEFTIRDNHGYAWYD
jgi:hypothetical protein